MLRAADVISAHCSPRFLPLLRDAADGWEDDRRDQKAFRGEKRVGIGPGVCTVLRGSKKETPANISRFCQIRLRHRRRKMSTSRQLSECRAIPTRTVLINDTTQLPHDYCTTPGGTLFSTTPGGKTTATCLSFFHLTNENGWRARCFHRNVCVMSPWPTVSSRSKQKQREAPPPLRPRGYLIGWFAAQRF